MANVLNFTVAKLLRTGENPFLNADVGVELEIEGTGLPRQCMGWSRKPEGSLRGANGRTIEPGEDLPDTPMEYVTNSACTLASLQERLTRLETLFHRTGTQVTLTHRASTHIHVNMLPESVDTMLSYIVLFTAIEPVLLRYCGSTRNGNLFCLPSYDTGELPLFMARVAAAAKSRSMFSTWPNRGKYACLNTDTMASFGTLEARCFPNEISTDRIMRWAKFLCNLRTVARETGIQKLNTFLTNAYSNPLDFWMTVTSFPESIFSQCYPEHPTDLLRFGIQNAVEALDALDGIFKEDAPRFTKKGLYAEIEQEFMPMPTPDEWNINPSMASGEE